MSQIDPAIAHALTGVAKGGITDPVRTATGYQIIKLVDMGKPENAGAPPAVSSVSAPAEADEGERAELAFKQILMTLKPDAKPKEAELLLTLAKQVQKSPGKCEEKSMAGAGDLSDMDFRVTLTRAVSSDLPEKLRDFLMKLKVGSASDPVITPQGIRLFMLCERIDLPTSKTKAPDNDDATRQAIYMEKLELEAQKYMRDLRRAAFIEVRAQRSE
jgi:peptidyl-prolyl cis-trans isomerase SurA